MSAAYSYPQPSGGRSNETARRVVGGLQILGLLVGLMWVSEILDTALGHRLDGYGILARDPDGLFGILTAPFLHLGFGHLISNTIPLVTLGIFIAIGGAYRLLMVTAGVALISGVGTWLTSPSYSVTIGASGLVFGYATYLVVRGIFNRKLGQLAIGVGVILVWGGALLGGLLPQDGISFQGHLFGAVGGILIAWLLAGRDRKQKAAMQGPSYYS
jgi:membrane associated rhomboid family serine protease